MLAFLVGSFIGGRKVHRPSAPRLSASFAIIGWAWLAPLALAQPDPSGIDFVTIGAPNNPAYNGPDFQNAVTGRGGVGYEYRLGRTEVTSAQWMEFYNAFYGRVPGLSLPQRWGASATGNPNQPFALTNAASGLWPAGGMTWRTSAMFVNWLNNDKSSDPSAVMSGAYDVSTFGYDEGGRFTDQRAHTPGARYWIPTLDEWIKGAYYDPNYDGTGVGGWWWNNTNGTNLDPIYGPPGLGQGNAGFDLSGSGQFRIPLLAYPETVTPWGLLDASGATSEFLETVRVVGTIPYRQNQGSSWSQFGARGDFIYGRQAEFPSSHVYQNGLRIAAAVPTSGGLVFFVTVSIVFCSRRVRSRTKEFSDETNAHSGFPARGDGAGPQRPQRQ